MAAAVVKIDSELLKEIKGFISKKDNKLKYVNKKQFVDIAVYELLKKSKRGKDKEKKKR